MKAKFICVSPISSRAQLIFELDMLKFHSCRVQKEEPEVYHLESITKHRFSISKNNDRNWMIVK
jgi:hypothetical protein